MRFVGRFNWAIWLDANVVVVSMAPSALGVAMYILVCILGCVVPIIVTRRVVCGSVDVVDIGLVKINVVVADEGLVIPVIVNVGIVSVVFVQIVDVVVLAGRSLGKAGIGRGDWDNIGNGEFRGSSSSMGSKLRRGSSSRGAIVVVAVVFRVIDGVIRMPLDDKTPVLDERFGHRGGQALQRERWQCQ
jgi:hypothetical protein